MRIFIPILACGFFSASVFGQSVPVGDPSLAWNDTDLEWFNKQRIYDNDRDGDNLLSREEIVSGEDGLLYFKDEAHFKDADRLADGKLSNEELRTFNQFEKQWLMEGQQHLLDSLIKIHPILAKPTSEWVDSEVMAFQRGLRLSYWLNHHLDFIKTYYSDGAWLTAHPKETLILLNNKLWLAQHPEIAKNLYPLTEPIWKRDPALSRWIRKHAQYIAEYKG